MTTKFIPRKWWWVTFDCPAEYVDGFIVISYFPPPLFYLPSTVCLTPASRVTDGQMVKKWTMF